MGLFIGDVEPSKIFLGDTPISKVFLGDTQIRPSGPSENFLCFTAQQANSTIALNKNGSPTNVSLETSSDGRTWSDYTFGTTITLTKVGSKIYWRNKSATPTSFGTSEGNYYQFAMTGLIAASGDINYLLCSGSTNTLLSNYCFNALFSGCTSLTSAPELLATTLTQYCYRTMFRGCSNLTTAPSILPANTAANQCFYRMFNNCTALVTAPSISATSASGSGNFSSMFYGCSSLTYLPKLYITTMVASIYEEMFRNCSSIKLSTTQTGDYTQPYRIPDSGTGTTASSWAAYMFSGTGGTFAVPPAINTTYYVHKDNTIV